MKNFIEKMKNKMYNLWRIIKSVFQWKILFNALFLFSVFVFLGWLIVQVLKIDVDKNKYTQLLFWFTVIDGSFITMVAFSKKFDRPEKKLIFHTFNFLFIFLVSFFEAFSQDDYSLLLFFVSLNLAIEQLINYKYFDNKKVKDKM
jgi:hypothetical protein